MTTKNEEDQFDSLVSICIWDLRILTHDQIEVVELLQINYECINVLSESNSFKKFCF